MLTELIAAAKVELICIEIDPALSVLLKRGLRIRIILK